MNTKITINIEIHTYYWQVIFDLLGQSQEIQISDDVKLELIRSCGFKDITQPSIFYLALSFAGGVAVDLLVNVAASWLYDKLNDRQQEVPHLIIERIEVELDKEQIRRVITEKIEMHSSDKN